MYAKIKALISQKGISKAKVDEKTMTRNRYNGIPHPVQDKRKRNTNYKKTAHKRKAKRIACSQQMAFKLS